ncbi:hypothetical protein PR048_006502 [Dryococelus australis]|uniref:Reversion-inducing cysteine-rich protein with Kazal EGF-like 1 domain-containing protein n=1 Tax=Dryococelus australis TaxID=614101 RepID=A0ABQ9IC59_9NEOP|nr:hypothetical protein PR048_006502 [Dryococelus australis]
MEILFVGCKMGEVSQYMVPAGTFVHIPLSRSGLLRSCYTICQCSANGIIEHCEPVPCFQMDSCLYGVDKISKDECTQILPCFSEGKPYLF